MFSIPNFFLTQAVQPSTGDVVYDQFEDGFMRGEFETRALHLQPSEIIIAGELTSTTKKVLSRLSINTYPYSLST
jgi:DNA mismatch repair protein MSH3